MDAPQIKPYAADLKQRRSRAYTAEAIIKTLDKDYKRKTIKIENVSDNLFGDYFAKIHQFIFGITRPGTDGGIEQYVVRMTGKLAPVGGTPVFYPFVFEGCQQRQLKKVLANLSGHYKAKLDVSAMARSAGMTERAASQRLKSIRPIIVMMAMAIFLRTKTKPLPP